MVSKFSLKLVTSVILILGVSSCVCVSGVYIPFSFGDSYSAVLEDGSTGGLRSVCLYKRYLRKRINPENIGIKTGVIYEDSHFYKNGNSYFYKDQNKGYFRFYKNGTAYLFYNYKIKRIDSTTFNPKKGDLCFVIKDKKKYWLALYSPGDGGSFNKIEIRMQGDTLVTYNVIKDNNIKNEYLFYKKELTFPQKWLDWKPDY